MDTARRLRQIFQLLVAPTLVVGCSSSVSRDGLTTDVCVNGRHDMLQGVEPREPVEWVGMVGWASSERGTKCGGATDAKTCLASLEARLTSAQTGPGFHGGQAGSNIIVFTRGDQVGSVSTLAELRAFIAPTSSPQAAALYAWTQGHRVVCGENNVGRTGADFTVLTRTGSTCGGDVKENRVVVTPSGQVDIAEEVVYESGDSNCAIGRRPQGLARARRHHVEKDLGSWLARVAHLEAASIFAFERLARELVELGAPESLVARAKASMRDEIRHARMMERLAKHHGADVESPVVPELAERSLVDICIENAIEGCVRETFGALVATYQAAHASDERLRRVMQRVARDETRHAALAWDIEAWADARLSESERADVHAARERASRQLRADLAADEPSVDVQSLAGLPSGTTAVALFDAWRAAAPS